MISERLRILMNGMRAKQLAEKLSIPPATLYSLLSGETTDPRLSSLRPLAKYFNVSIDQITGDAPLSNAKIDSATFAVPVLKKEDVEAWLASELEPRTFLYMSENESMPINERCFAIKATSHAMQALFKIGSYLILNPELTLNDNDVGLFKLSNQNQEVFIRQAAIEGGNKLLISPNPQFPVIPLSKNDACLGVLTSCISYQYST